MNYSSYSTGISFRLVRPDDVRGQGGRFSIGRTGHGGVRLLELPGAPIDVINTALPDAHGRTKHALRHVCHIPRMSTFAIGSMISRAVAEMPDDHSFVNVGVWHGFTLLAGMSANRDKRCIGVDNFSEFGGPAFGSPKNAFTRRFEKFRGKDHRFYEMDWGEYFSEAHSGPIGVYVYDGDHSYDSQRQALDAAEPFFGDGCLIFVDDTNWVEPRQATLDFAHESRHHYSSLFECRTAVNGHPTFWNGLMVLQVQRSERGSLGGELLGNGGIDASDGSASEAGPEETTTEGIDPELPTEGVGLVSIIIVNDRPAPEPLARTIESALNQTWPAVEIVVADESPTECSREVAGDFGDRVAFTVGRDSVLNAIDATRGGFVSIVEAGIRLEDTAVHMGIEFPGASSFSRALRGGRYRYWERGLDVARALAAAIPPGRRFVLASEGLRIPRSLEVRSPLPFPGRRGRPRDDGAAIGRLEMLRDAGAEFIAFMWPAFPWLKDFPRFAGYLRSNYPPVLENDLVVVFDLTANPEIAP